MPSDCLNVATCRNEARYYASHEDTEVTLCGVCDDVHNGGKGERPVDRSARFVAIINEAERQWREAKEEAADLRARLRRLRQVVGFILTGRQAVIAQEVAKAVKAEREACAIAADRAELPPRYQWGEDAMEQFDFGKERAAVAIRDRGLCAQCKSNVRWNEGGGHKTTAEECRAYCQRGHRPPAEEQPRQGSDVDG